MQLNKGYSDLQNRIPHINQLLDQHKPQVFIINEINLHKWDKLTIKVFPNYKLIFYNLIETNKYARTGILIHKNINFKRRKDLEAPGNSTVWVKINPRNKNTLLIQGGTDSSKTGNPKHWKYFSPKTKMGKTIEKWDIANQEQCTIISMGDYNLNKCSWDIPTQDKNTYQVAEAPMSELLTTKMLDRGTRVLNNQPTRNWDLIMTNRVNQIVSHDTIQPNLNDHALMVLIKIIKPVKKLNISKQEISSTYKENIRNHHIFTETQYLQDPSEIPPNYTANYKRIYRSNGTHPQSTDNR